MLRATAFAVLVFALAGAAIAVPVVPPTAVPTVPPTLQQRRSAPSSSQQHEWMLSSRATDTASLEAAARQAHFGGWSVHPNVERAWKRLQKAQSEEALQHYGSMRAANLDVQDEALHRPHESFEEFTRHAGLLETAEVQDVIDAFEYCFDSAESDLDALVEFMLTDDVVVTLMAPVAGGGERQGGTCRGKTEARQCLQELVDQRLARCAHIDCDRITTTSDTLHTTQSGPVVLLRVIETFHTASASSLSLETRILHLFSMILRPPPFNSSLLSSSAAAAMASAPLSHSRIAVLEYMQAAVPGDYEPPLELVRQARVVEDHVWSHEHHWNQLHADAVRETHERYVRIQRSGWTAEHAHAAPDILKWCRRRRERGESTGFVDCEHPLLVEHAKEKPERIAYLPSEDRVQQRRRSQRRHGRRRADAQQ